MERVWWRLAAPRLCWESLCHTNRSLCYAEAVWHGQPLRSRVTLVCSRPHGTSSSPHTTAYQVLKPPWSPQAGDAAHTCGRVLCCRRGRSATAPIHRDVEAENSCYVSINSASAGDCQSSSPARRDAPPGPPSEPADGDAAGSTCCPNPRNRPAPSNSAK